MNLAPKSNFARLLYPTSAFPRGSSPSWLSPTKHRQGSTVGKVVAFHPDAHEGLIADVKIAKTLAGDETLALADEGMIFPSVGFAVVKGSDQELDHRSTPNTRYVRRAFVDHMGFTEDPAYIGAGVLAVRSAADAPPERNTEPLSTPRLDEWVQYLQSRRAGLSA
jgi:phage head maturation protease